MFRLFSVLASLSWNAFVPALISGIGALGGLFGGRGQKQKQTSRSSSHTTNLQEAKTHNFGVEGPQLTGQQQGLLDQIVNKATGYLNEDTDLSGYQAGQTNQINALADIQKKAAEETLAAKGVSGGPATATALNSVDANAFANKVNLAQSIPMLRNQIMSQKLADVGQVFSRIPTATGYENYGNVQNTGAQYTDTEGEGEQSQSGNMLGGLFGNLAPILAFLYGQGAFRTKGKNTGFGLNPEGGG